MRAVEVSLKVLLASDSSDFAGSFKTALENAGYKVEGATTTEDVLAASSNAYEVIFLDLDLAEVDGMALLHELRERKGAAAPPVVLLKGEGEPAHIIQRGLDLGASGYVLKHRLPRDLPEADVMELTRGVGRADACPYSASDRFDGCAVFLPLNTSIRNGAGPRISCSHLRVGTAAPWRLYPRCALGDESARDKYFRDQSS